MSEQSQGPGWWQASDGKWYPPEQAPTGTQPAVDPTAAQPAYAAPAAATAGGGGGASAKIIAIIVAVVVLAGGAAFALTRDSGGGGSVKAFCDEAKRAKQQFPGDIFRDLSKIDAAVAEFDKLDKAAPKEIKADMDTMTAAAKKLRDAVKSGKDLDTVFSSEEDTKVTKASDNVTKFAKDKCGVDLENASDSTDLFSSDSFSSSSDFNTDFDSFLSDFSDSFGSDFLSSFNSDFFSSDFN